MSQKIRRGKARKLATRVLISIIVVAFLAGAFSGISAFKLLSGRGPTTSGVSGESGQLWTAGTQTASTKIAAVTSDGSTGIISDLKVEISPGEGRILVDTYPLIGFDFQSAERTAVEVASRMTGVKLNDNGGLMGADVLYVVSTPTGGSVEVQSIDGPSAGATTTVATIAAIENTTVRKDVIMTGTIQENGSIGQVGGVLEKAKAANDAGAKLFLVPSGQSVVTIYKEVTRQVGPFSYTTYAPVQIDLNQYAENAGWSIKIQEVSTIQEAENLMLD
jgi:uncharacterized protein